MSDIQTLTIDIPQHINQKYVQSIPTNLGFSCPNHLSELLCSPLSWAVYVEKGIAKNEDELLVNIIFAVDTLGSLFSNGKKTLLLRVLFIKQLPPKLIGVSWITGQAGTQSNRNLSLHISFSPYHGPLKFKTFTADCIERIIQLSISKERSDLIKNRIQTWDIYLNLLNEKAKMQEATLSYQSYRISENHRKIVFKCNHIQDEIENKRLNQAAVRLITNDSDEESGNVIGSLEQIKANEMVVELDDYYYSMALRNILKFNKKGKIQLSNIGELSQSRRLIGGMQKLKNGKAINPKTEDILFGDVSTLGKGQSSQPLEESLHQNLNEYQMKAVEGALNAEDIYLIQGPPGTGKTTVIAEICYQNAKRGLKTLVASQSNLAVDNALSKLEHHKSIRILRKGNADSVESEGKPFLEENVVEEWLRQTQEASNHAISNDQAEIDTINAEIKSNREKIELEDENDKQLLLNQQQYEAELKQQKDSLLPLQAELNDKNERLRKVTSDVNLLNEKHQDLLKQIKHEQLQIDVIEQSTKDDLKAVDTLQEQVSSLVNRLEPFNVHKQSIDQYYQWRKQASALTEQINEYKREIELASNKKLAQQDILQKLYQYRQKRIDDKASLIVLKEYQHLLAKNSGSDHENISLLNRINYHVDKCDHLYKELMNKKNNFNNLNTMYEQALLTARSEQLLLAHQSLYIDSSVANWEDNLKREIAHVLKSKPSLINNVISFFKGKNEKKDEWYSSLNIVLNKAAIGLNTSKQQMQLMEANLNNHMNSAELDNVLNQLVYKITTQLNISIKQSETTVDNINRSLQLREQAKHQLQLQINELENKMPELKHKTKEQFDVFIVTLTNEWISKRNQLLKQEEDNNQSFPIRHEKVQQHKQAIDTLRLNINAINDQLDLLQSSMVLTKEELKSLDSQIANNKSKITELTYILENLLQLRAKIVEKMASYTSEIKQLEQKLEFLHKKIALSQKWVNQLNQVTDNQKETIKKIYIKHANVIGITCVQSASKDFSESYPNFDAVIIDEVSKATPPELLLPMLKGKKTILVGDHRQLPPMLGNETLQELVEKGDYSENEKAEMINYFKESLFERLYQTLPQTNKQMLKIQYRMHPQIMNTINQFYDDNLFCGLPNPDEARNHGLNGELVNPSQHALWIDVPLHAQFKEEQDHNSKSYYNEAELKIIYHLLIELNEAAKLTGKTKEIGLISFYGAQVKKMNEWMDHFSHLHLRIGTVDRFQGIEKDIIIASFVRNNINKKIGFASDERRVNVALSRARELLVVVGCGQLFSIKAPYKRVIAEISSHDGVINLQGQAITS